MNWEVRTMRFGISCFNSPLFRKNAARFWPIWGGYLLLWAFWLPLQFLSLPGQYASRDEQALAQAMTNLAESVLRTLQSGVWLSCLFGLAAAMAVFSYLYSSRSACMMHALPLNRTGLFFTNYVSGLSFLLLPHVLIFAMTLALEAMYGCVNLYQLGTWLWAQSATALFFYSFAVFCAMFTGNLLALPAFYGILNFLVYCLFALLSQVLSLFFYGWEGMGDWTEELAMWLTPPMKLYDACTTYVFYDLPGVDSWSQSDQLNEPGVLLLFAAVGVGLSVLALWVYHRRHVESAGDVVAIPIVRPVFRIGVAVCSGLSLGLFTTLTLSLDSKTLLGVFIALWTAAGYFVAEMLLKKSFRVLNCCKGALVITAVMGMLFLSVQLDWFGYERRIPAPEQVSSVCLTNFYDGGPYDHGNYYRELELTDPTVIQQIIDLHTAIVHEKDRSEQPGDASLYFGVRYTLADGSTLSRRYSRIPVFEGEQEAVGSVTRAATQLIHNRDLIRMMYELDAHQNDRLSEVYLESTWASDYDGYQSNVYLTNSDQELQLLWQAVLQDFDEGTIGVRYLFGDSSERRENTYTANLNFVFERKTSAEANADRPNTVSVGYYAGVDICLTPNAQHTLDWFAQYSDIRPGVELKTHAEVRQ